MRHLSTKQIDNARNLGKKVICKSCLDTGCTVRNPNKYVCSQCAMEKGSTCFPEHVRKNCGERGNTYALTARVRCKCLKMVWIYIHTMLVDSWGDFGGSWKFYARHLIGFERYLRPKSAWDGSWAAQGRLCGGLGWLLGSPGQAMGMLFEATRRHLVAEAVIARIFDDFCKIWGNLESHFGRVLASKIEFWSVRRERLRHS